MGYFSYICNGCRKNIRFDGIHGEWCVLQHVRHAKLIGQTEGEYDGYGRIVADPYFRRSLSAHPNSKVEIELSESMSDSRRDLGAFAMSGIAAWHKKCYYEAPVHKRNALLISKEDPDRGKGPALRASFTENNGDASIQPNEVWDILKQNGLQMNDHASYVTVKLPSGHELVLRDFELAAPARSW